MEHNFPHQYICIEGNIGSGKTTFAKMLSEEYGGQLILEAFDDNPFLPLFYKEKERYAFPVELFFMTERYKQLEGKLLHQDLFRQFTVSDYAFVKSLLFARINLIDQEYRLFQKMWQVLNAGFPKPDLLVYFHRDISYLLESIRKRGRSYEQLIQADYLKQVQDMYFDYFKNILTFPVLILDLNDIDFVHQESHYSSIKKIIASNYRPGVHQVRMVF